MDLADLWTIALLLVTVVSVAPAARRQWREDRAGFLKTLKMLVGFFAYCAAGIAIMIALSPEPQPPGEESNVRIFSVIGFFLGWVFLGALWLARLVPRYQDVPAWVDRRYGPVELALVGLIGLSLVLRFLA